jgi:serine/threonine protein kinase
VIKNQPAYYHQARVEVGILQLLNGRCDPSDSHHIVRLHDAFLHRRHLCLAFEQLGINLFELLKRNGFRGLSLGLLRLFLQQVRLALSGFDTFAVTSALCGCKMLCRLRLLLLGCHFPLHFFVSGGCPPIIHCDLEPLLSCNSVHTFCIPCCYPRILVCADPGRADRAA